MTWYKKFRKFVKWHAPKPLIRMYVWYRYRLFMIKQLVVPYLLKSFGLHQKGTPPSTKLREMLGDAYGKDRIVVSLTSYYPRVKRCIPTLKSLLELDYTNYTVELNLWWDCPVPPKLQRFLDKHKERIHLYQVGKNPSDHDKKVHADWSLIGKSPICKSAFTLRRHPDVYIAICDDDIIYHPWWLSCLYYSMLYYNSVGIKNISVGYCGVVLNNDKLTILQNAHYNAPLDNTISPALFMAGCEGILFGPGLNNKLDVLDHWARCVNIHPKAQLVDDVVVGSWLHCIKTQCLVVPKLFYNFHKAWIPKRTRISHKQNKQYTATGQRIDDIVWEALSKQGLIGPS